MSAGELQGSGQSETELLRSILRKLCVGDLTYADLAGSSQGAFPGWTLTVDSYADLTTAEAELVAREFGVPVEGVL